MEGSEKFKNMQRFIRQTILPNFGNEAQQKLLNSKVLVIGAGGLGCPCLQYLVSCGIGAIGIVDGDTIDHSNLQRQILFTTNDVGKNKAIVAKEKLKDIHPSTKIDSFPFFVDEKNAIDLISKYNVVVDCTDDFKTRYLINDVCAELSTPLIFGANFQFEGQIAVFKMDDTMINLRDVFPTPPKQAMRCEEAGALGAVLGILGSLQALETIKLITEQKDGLNNEMLYLNLMKYETLKIKISKKMSDVTFPMSGNTIIDLNVEEFIGKINNPAVQLIDVRNEIEIPKVDFECIQIPLPILKENIHLLNKEKEIVLFCHIGVRSLEALELLQDEFDFQHVSHLKGGIMKYFSMK
jgi:molybdopterin/thiamine biosynthesis adenylyltransferase/rhodanese-related sulfurtransferase